MMHGAGSWNSPIVIESDDDDEEAYVELALEQRLSSPRRNVDVEYDDWDYEDIDDAVSHRLWAPSASHYLASAPEVNGFDIPPPNGQKRKRTFSDASFYEPARPPPPPPASFGPSSSKVAEPFDSPPKESKNARKKRRRREEAERLRALGHTGMPIAGPSTLPKAISSTFPPLYPPPLSTSNGYARPSGLPYALPTPFSLPSKPSRLPPPFPPPLPPPTSIASQLPPSSYFTHPLPAPPHPLAHAGHAAPSSSTGSVSESGPSLKYMIGKPPDDDPDSQHGTFFLPLEEPAPNPARTLVMETIPKKLRGTGFVLSWAKSVIPQSFIEPRVKIDSKRGRALIEFPSADLARTAWASPRMVEKGRSQIRVWWYRVPGVGAGAGVGELEEGEVEDGELQPRGKKTKTKNMKNMTKRGLPRNPPGAPVPMPVHQYQSKERGRQWLPDLPTERAQYQPSGSILPKPLPLPPFTYMPPISAQLSQDLRVPKISLSFNPQPLAPLPLPQRSPLDISDRATSMDLASDDGLTQHTLSDSEALATADGDIIMDDDSASIASSRSATPALEVQHVMSEPEEQWPVAHLRSSVALAPLSSLSPEAPSFKGSFVSARLHSPSPEASPLPVCAPIPVTAQPAVTPAVISAQRDELSVSLLSPATTESSTICVPFVAPGPSPSPSNSSGLSTHTPPPSEPRAMKNAPKGPSYVKRSLLARQKELEEKIARSKEEIAARSGTTTPASHLPEAAAEDSVNVHSIKTTITASSIHVVESDSQVQMATVAAPELEGPATAMAKEDNLRRLVLDSKRVKVVTGPMNEHSEADRPTHTTNLHDLAVSFIAESIQTVSPTAHPVQSSSMPATTTQARMSEKAILAAKQRLLEKHIADTKLLMARLGTATSKQEKSQIVKEMKESTRVMEGEMQSLTLASKRNADAGRYPGGSNSKMRWPETKSCVLVISDDESDYED